MGTPFKMKGSPMQRNFGIGSPLHDNEKKTKMVEGTTIFGQTISDVKAKVKKGVEAVTPPVVAKGVKYLRDELEGYAERKKASNERNN